VSGSLNLVFCFHNIIVSSRSERAAYEELYYLVRLTNEIIMWNGGHPYRDDDIYNNSDYAVYQAQAMEALRRQEEMRQQAYLALHQHQLQHPYAAAQRAIDHDQYANAEEDYRANADVAVAREPVAVAREPVAVARESVAVAREPVAVARESVAVVATPVADDQDDEEDASATVIVVDEDAAQRQTPTKSKKKPAKKKNVPSPKKKSSPVSVKLGPSLDDPVPEITDKEYSNLEDLMVQFCRVPLLAEFSRPVSLLHPEVSIS
jgi:hypothetical protein